VFSDGFSLNLVQVNFSWIALKKKLYLMQSKFWSTNKKFVCSSKSEI